MKNGLFLVTKKDCLIKGYISYIDYFLLLEMNFFRYNWQKSGISAE